MPNSTDGLKVVCIAGTGQNGATVLSRMLGRLPGMVAAGEVGFLWDRALLGDQPCGCGQPFSRCPFWSRVGDEAFGGWSGVDPRRATELRDAILLRRRHLSLPMAFPFMLWPGLSPRYSRNLQAYAGLVRRLYEGIRTASGAEVIVDSTKVPGHAYMLRRMEGVDVRVVHLVRDSRGVAYSNLRLVERQSSIGGKTHRGRHAPHNTAARWMWINLSIEVLARLGGPSMRVGYESLIRSPREELERIMAFAGSSVAAGDLDFVRDGEVDLPVGHLVAGNRMRQLTGRVPLRVDDAWRTGLDPRQQRLVHLMTWPLLRRYGIRGESGS